VLDWPSVFTEIIDLGEFSTSRSLSSID